MPANPRNRNHRFKPAGSLILLVLVSLNPFAPMPHRLLAAEDTPDQLVDSLYGPDLKKAKATPDTKDDLALADKLIADAKNAGKNKGFEAALLKRAVALSLEDMDGAATAQAATELAIAAQAVTPVVAWQDLTDKAALVLRRRNLGKADKLLEPDFAWLLLLARAAVAAGDSPLADRILSTLIRDAQTNRFKLVTDDAQQLQAEIRFQAPFQSAAKRELAKLKNSPDDPKLNQQVAEAVLGQTGDWDAAVPLFKVANDARWNLIMQLHDFRLHAPAPAKAPAGEAKPDGDDDDDHPKADPAKPPDHDTSVATPTPTTPATGAAAAGSPPAAAGPTVAAMLSAADFLIDQASAAKHPSPVGKLALASEALAIAQQAAAADQSGLTTTQKMDLAKSQHNAQDVLTKAQEEQALAFDRVLRLNWLPLLSRTLQADWTQVGNGTKWEIQGGGELKGDGDWDSCLRSLRTKPVDFIFEAEFIRKAETAHAFILMREHGGSPVYSLELGEDHVHLLFSKGGGAEEREVAKRDPGSARDRWCKLRVAVDGDHWVVWLDGTKVFDLHDTGELTAGGLCIGAAKGEIQYRNLRLRELP